MADDNTLRSQRSNEPLRRSAQPSGGQASSGDPLAELARLIGQNDPFADFGRDTRADAREQQPPQPKAPMSDWRKAAAAMPAYEPLPEERAEETVRRQPPMRSEPHFDSAPPADPVYPRHDPYQMASPADEPADAQDARYDRHESQFAADPHQRGDAEPFHQRHDAEAFQHHQQDDRVYAAPRYEARGQQQQQPYFEEGAALTPHDEESYDDPPRVRRHGGLLTAVTLIGCAMIGTAGAYGYRTYYVAPSASKSPPVITAETTPSKVVSAGDVQSGKVITDRVREPGQNERVVSREEQPVEIRTPPASGPRVVLPAPVAPSQSMFPPPPGATQPPAAAGPGPGGSGGAAGSTPGNGSEPKRIRTVTIRPDGTDLSGRPVGGAGQPGASAPSARPVPAPKSAPPTARGNSGAASSGPISLDPQATASTQPGPRDRQAVQPPAPQAAVQPPAPRVSAVQPNNEATGATGGYAVQLSSQRSEAEAQASFRALQVKYPSQLGSRSSFVKRVDLGAKGIYYRAMVGPFSSSGEARQFCTDLKAAGGNCVVPQN